MLLERLGPNLDDLGMSVPEITRNGHSNASLVLATLGRGLRSSVRSREGGVAGRLHHDDMGSTGKTMRAHGHRATVRYCDERATAYDPSRSGDRTRRRSQVEHA